MADCLDAGSLAAEPLKKARIRSACLIHDHNLTINHGPIREIAQDFDKMPVLVIEGFVPPRKQIDAAIRFDRYGPVAVQLYFEKPLPVRQFWDRGAIHRLDEVGFPFWKGFQPRCAA